MMQLLKDIEEGKRFIKCRKGGYNLFTYKKKYYLIDINNGVLRELNRNRFIKNFNDAFRISFMGENNFTFPALDLANLMERIKGNVIENEYDDKFIYVNDDLIVIVSCSDKGVKEDLFDFFVEDFETIELKYLFFEIFSIYESDPTFTKSIKKISLPIE